MARIALVIPLEVMEAIVHALEAPTVETLTSVLDDAWARGRARRAVTTSPLDLRLQAQVPPALVPLVSRAPPLVRTVMQERALLHAGRLQALSKLAAPPAVIDGSTRNLKRALEGLDPASPMPDEEAPKVISQDEGPDVHAWLESVLEHARGPGLVESRLTVPEPQATDTGLATMRPGIQWTAFSVIPSPALWATPDVTLSRRLDEGRVVVGESGGPVTFALPGDTPPEPVLPEAASLVRSLRPDQAVVAFRWRDTGMDLPWSERP
ncbi:MAG: hypothetical protein JNJ54_03570 [Myxococcaceae bacterium]|nr:hypothetical protein [Myxococcaceae bacterium]